MEKSDMISRLGTFKDVGVLVVGDLMVDEFLYGKVSRISPEAPVPILNFSLNSIALGGAANAAINIAALGGRPLLIGCIGDDYPGRQFEEKLRAEKVDGRGVAVVRGRLTTLKTRIIAHTQQVVRIDKEETVPVAPETMAEMIDNARTLAALAKAILISDYEKGAVSGELAAAVLGVAAERGLPVVVDTKRREVGIFSGATVFTPNISELERFSGIRVDEQTLAEAGKKVLAASGAKALLVTRAEQGMTLLSADGSRRDWPAHATQVHDVTGAGDTVAAAVALGLASGLSLEDAVEIANYAAAVVVRKVGTATATPAEMVRLIAGEG